MELYGLVQHVTVPTRISSHSNSVIDLMMSNIKNISYTGCIDYNISDHYPTYVVKKRITVTRQKERVYGRPLNRLNWEEFHTLLLTKDWNNIFLEGNLDKMWSDIKNSITIILDKICPYKWMTVITNKPVWLNSELMELAKERDRLFRIFRKSKHTRINIYTEAVSKRREFNRRSKLCRENFYKEQLMLYKNDQSKFWCKVYELVGSPIVAPIENVFRYETTILLDLKESVQEINNFFAHVGERIVSEIPSIPDEVLDRADD